MPILGLVSILTFRELSGLTGRLFWVRPHHVPPDLRKTHNISVQGNSARDNSKPKESPVLMGLSALVCPFAASSAGVKVPVLIQNERAQAIRVIKVFLERTSWKYQNQRI